MKIIIMADMQLVKELAPEVVVVEQQQDGLQEDLRSNEWLCTTDLDLQAVFDHVRSRLSDMGYQYTQLKGGYLIGVTPPKWGESVNNKSPDIVVAEYHTYRGRDDE